MTRLLAITAVAMIVSTVPGQDDPVFSGPQVGEKLPPLPVIQVLSGANDGKTSDLASQAPTLLVFVHQFTRPSIMFTRTLMQYAAKRKSDGLSAGLVFLGNDRTSLEAQLQRAKHALPTGVTVGISPDGVEGPGSYGLNRDITLTILAAKDGVVTANMALVDPNIPTQLPKALQAICKIVGGEPPKVEELMKATQMARGTASTPQRSSPVDDPKVEALLRQLIQKDNSDETVNRVAAQIDELVKDQPKTRNQIKAIAGRVYDKYGTPRAQFHLRRWAEVKAAE